MKISDSLGNLYTHTMFKKKAYEMPAMAKNQNQEDSDEITGLEFVFEIFCQSSQILSREKLTQNWLVQKAE